MSYDTDSHERVVDRMIQTDTSVQTLRSQKMVLQNHAIRTLDILYIVLKCFIVIVMQCITVCPLNTRKLLNQGVILAKLKSSLRKFYGCHHDIIGAVTLYVNGLYWIIYSHVNVEKLL